MTFPAQHLSISIDRPAASVYEFVANPTHLPQWAAGLAGGIQKVGEQWVADSPLGPVTVRFAESNPFGVLDHDVALPTGETFYNPMRVYPNHDGCEVVFTLYRRPEMSDEEYTRDASAIETDLQTLKTILER